MDASRAANSGTQPFFKKCNIHDQVPMNSVWMTCGHISCWASLYNWLDFNCEYLSLWNSTWLSVNQKNQHPSPSPHVSAHHELFFSSIVLWLCPLASHTARCKSNNASNMMEGKEKKKKTNLILWEHYSLKLVILICTSNKIISCWEADLRKPYFSFLWTSFLVGFAVISELHSLWYVWTSHPLHRACGDGSRHFDVLHLLYYSSHVKSIVMWFALTGGEPGGPPTGSTRELSRRPRGLSLLSVRMLNINRKFCVLQWFFSWTSTPFCYSPISSSALLLSELAPHYPPLF